MTRRLWLLVERTGLLCWAFGHVWLWEEGERPFCGGCLKPIPTDVLLKIARDAYRSGLDWTPEEVAALEEAEKDEPEIREMDLPGAWSYADFTGGPPDEVRGPDWTPGSEVR